MLLDILGILAPVFVCAAIGFGWMRLQIPFDTNFVSRIVTSVGAPCLIFATFMEVEIDPQAFKTMMIAALLSIVVFGAVGYGVLRFAGLSQRAFLPSQMFPNGGNMGLPLCLLAFGDQGLALGLTYFMISIVFGFTLGMSISSGETSARQLFANPTFYAVAITLILMFSGLRPPQWVADTTDLLGGLTIPLMLIALGVSLAQFRISSLKRSLALSLLRLGLGFVVSLGLAELLGLEGVARGVLILQGSMPVAVFSYLFAVRYGRQPEEVAGTVVLSTLISFLTLPLLLWYVLPMAG